MSGKIRRKTLKDGSQRFYAAINHDGREHALGSYKNKRNAETVVRRAEAEIAAGTFGMNEAMTFSGLSQIWLRSIKLDVKPAAYMDYEMQVRCHLEPFFGKMKIDVITPADVDKYRTAMAGEKKPDGSSWSTRRTNKALTVLGAIFRFAVEQEYLQKSPTRVMKKVKETNREMDFFNPEEVQRLLDACSPDFYPICFTAVMTGLRTGELFGLKWSDVDFSEKVVRVRRSYHPVHGFNSTKSAKGERSVVMSPALAEVLAGHKAKTGGGTDDLVFRTKDGTPIDYRNSKRTEYHKALDRAGLRRIRFHDLRHTYAALMISIGVNSKTLQGQLGHADIGVTLNTYGHLLPDALDGIGESLDQMVCPTGARWPMEGLVRVK